MSESQALIVSIEDCRMWAKLNPTSPVGFKNAYNVAEKMRRQGKMPIIVWHKRKPLQVIEAKEESADYADTVPTPRVRNRRG